MSATVEDFVRLYSSDFGRFFTTADIDLLIPTALKEFSILSKSSIKNALINPDSECSPYYSLPDDFIDAYTVVYNDFYMEKLHYGVEWRYEIKQCPFGYWIENHKIRLFPWGDECKKILRSNDVLISQKEKIEIVQCDIISSEKLLFDREWLVEDCVPIELRYLAVRDIESLSDADKHIVALLVLSELYKKDNSAESIKKAGIYYKEAVQKINLIYNVNQPNIFFRPDPFQ